MTLSDKQKKLVDAILADPRYGRFPRSVIEFIVMFDEQNGIDWIKKHGPKKKDKRASAQEKKAAAQEKPKAPLLHGVEEVVQYGVVVSEKPGIVEKDRDGPGADQEAGDDQRADVLL